MKKVITKSSQLTTINYDKDAQALYIKLGRAKIYETKKISALVFADVDKKGNIVGVEILNATQRAMQKMVSSWLPNISLSKMVSK